MSNGPDARRKPIQPSAEICAERFRQKKHSLRWRYGKVMDSATNGNFCVQAVAGVGYFLKYACSSARDRSAISGKIGCDNRQTRADQAPKTSDGLFWPPAHFVSAGASGTWLRIDELRGVSTSVNIGGHSSLEIPDLSGLEICLGRFNRRELRARSGEELFRRSGNTSDRRRKNLTQLGIVQWSKCASMTCQNVSESWWLC